MLREGIILAVFIKSIDADKGKLLLEAGLEKEWVIQAVNNEKVQNISDLKKQFNEYSGENVSIKAVRNYQTKIFKLQLP